MNLEALSAIGQIDGTAGVIIDRERAETFRAIHR
jgi:hypothetical protein